MPARHTAEPGYGQYPPFPESSSVGGREQLEKIVDLIFRRKWIVLASFLIVLAGTAIYTMTLVPQYQTTSFVMLNLGQVTLDFSRAKTSGEGTSESLNLFARSDRTIYNEIRLLQISDELVQRVRRRLQEETYGVADSTASDSASGGPRRPFVPLNGRVVFTPDRGSNNILQMEATSSDAERAALLSNLYAEEYVRLTQEASRSYVSALRTSLEEQEKEHYAKLQSLEQQVEQYIIDQGGIGLSMDVTRMVQQIATLERDRDDARFLLRAEQAKLQSMDKELEEINPQVAQRIASTVEQRINMLMQQLATEQDALATILLENPELRERGADRLEPFTSKIKRLEAQIDSLSVQMVNEVTASGGLRGSADGLAYVANLRRDIVGKRVLVSEMEAKLEVMDKRLADYEEELQEIPAQSMQLTQMQREKVQTELMYQAVRQKLQEARTVEESEPGYARLLRSAPVPRAPVFPDPRQNLIFGAFFGLMLGLALAVVRDKLDNRIYKPDQLRDYGLKEIGVIPNIEPLIKEDYQGKLFLEQDGHRFATSLVTLVNPIAAATEAYRHVRTNIQFNHPDTDVQTLLVASPGIMEGKSTTAANLAIVMAQAGRRTLLIDADLRRPRQHRIFGLKREAGLVELLSQGAEFEPEAWKTYVDNLYVLTAGRTYTPTNVAAQDDDDEEGRVGLIANPSELLGSDQMYRVLEALRETFDVIVIDTPPILAATDAALLSTQCDAAIVVARAGKTKDGELKFALETFNDVGANVLGVLLNAFDINMAYGLKYRYQHYTRYGRYSKYGYYGYRPNR